MEDVDSWGGVDPRTKTKLRWNMKNLILVVALVLLSGCANPQKKQENTYTPQHEDTNTALLKIKTEAEQKAWMENYLKDATSSWVVVDGFRGIKWGEKLEVIKSEKKMVLSSGPEKTMQSLYSIKDDQMSIGGASLDYLFYLFYEGKFSGVAIGTKGKKNYSALVDATDQKYKNCHLVNKYLDDYQCFTKGASVIIKYNRFSEAGSLVINSDDIQNEMAKKKAQEAGSGAAKDF